MKTNKLNLTLLGLLALSAMGIPDTVMAIPTYPGGAKGTPITTGTKLIATGGNVTITYLGWVSANYDEYLFLATPGHTLSGTTGDSGGPWIVYNKQNGQQTTPSASVNLGYFAPGEEVELGLWVKTTKRTFYSGPSDRNEDNIVHAYVVNDYLVPGQTYVGFEDLYVGNSPDYNYSDLRVTLTGVNQVQDTAGTLSLLALGFASVVVFARQRVNPTESASR